MNENAKDMAEGREVKGFQILKVVSISIAHLVHDSYTSILNIILPLLIAKFGITLTMAGLLNLILRLPSLLNPLIGIMADRSAVRWFIVFTPAISAIGMSLIGIAPNYTIVAILIFVVGISSSFFHVPAPVLIRNVSGSRIGKGMSFYMLGGEAARTLGPLVVVAAVEMWSFEGIWKLIPFALAATAVLFFMLRDADVRKPVTPFRNTRKERRKDLWRYTQTLIPVLLAISGITFFQALMKSALSAFLTVYLTDQGNSFAYAGILFAIFQFAGAASVLISGTWSDRIGRIRMLQLSAITSPLFMWLFVFLGNFWIIPLLLLLGLSIFATTPVILAYLQEVGKERPSYINGVYMTISFAVGAIAVVFVGLMGDWWGLQTTYEITAYIGTGMFPFVLYLNHVGKMLSKG